MGRIRAKIAKAMDNGYRRLKCKCANGHEWYSDPELKTEDNGGVADPICPECGRNFAEEPTPVRRAVYDASVKCGPACKKANPDTECICSCAGENHGMLAMTT